jgi:hypothetical protein
MTAALCPFPSQDPVELGDPVYVQEGGFPKDFVGQGLAQPLRGEGRLRAPPRRDKNVCGTSKHEKSASKFFWHSHLFSVASPSTLIRPYRIDDELV